MDGGRGCRAGPGCRCPLCPRLAKRSPSYLGINLANYGAPSNMNDRRTHRSLVHWLVVTGTCFIFFHSVGNFIRTVIPTDFHSIIFQRGRSTTNQVIHTLYILTSHEGHEEEIPEPGVLPSSQILWPPMFTGWIYIYI